MRIRGLIVEKMSAKAIQIIVPVTIWDKLEEIEKKQGIRKEDIVMRAVVKVIEEFSESKKGGGR
jgi:hypothetical protein